MKSIVENQFQYELYHPKIFTLLKEWIAILKTASDEELITELQNLVPDYPYYNKIRKVIKQSCPISQRIRRRFVFFDCFQTMRWIHHLRDQHHPSIPIEKALSEAPFVQVDSEPPVPSEETLFDWTVQQQSMYEQEMSARGLNYQL